MHVRTSGPRLDPLEHPGVKGRTECGAGKGGVAGPASLLSVPSTVAAAAHRSWRSAQHRRKTQVSADPAPEAPPRRSSALFTQTRRAQLPPGGNWVLVPGATARVWVAQVWSLVSLVFHHQNPLLLRPAQKTACWEGALDTFIPGHP